jgi:hypothetical protein
MQIPVLLEPISGNGYRARTGEPLALTAEGATADEAVRRLEQLVTARVSGGTRLVQIQIPAPHPWLPFAGTLKDDPLLEDWKQAMAEHRQAVENDPDIL